MKIRIETRYVARAVDGRRRSGTPHSTLESPHPPRPRLSLRQPPQVGTAPPRRETESRVARAPAGRVPRVPLPAAAGRVDDGSLEFPDGARGHGARGAPPRGRGAPPRARDSRPDSVSDLHSSCPSLPVASGVAVGSAAGAVASGGARPWRVARGCLRASLTSRLASLALASRLSGLRIRARSAVRVLRRGRGAWVERVEQLGGAAPGGGQRQKRPARPLARSPCSASLHTAQRRVPTQDLRLDSACTCLSSQRVRPNVKRDRPDDGLRERRIVGQQN